MTRLQHAIRTMQCSDDSSTLFDCGMMYSEFRELADVAMSCGETRSDRHEVVASLLLDGEVAK